MPVFRLQDNLPEIYTDDSRDFQLLCRLYDCVNNGVIGDISSMSSITFTKECRSEILELLGGKLGFFTEEDFDDDTLRYILMAFPEIIKNKGSKRGIEEVLNIFSKINHLKTKLNYSLSGYTHDHIDETSYTLTLANVVRKTLTINLTQDADFPSGDFYTAGGVYASVCTYIGAEPLYTVKLEKTSESPTVYSASNLWFYKDSDHLNIYVSFKMIGEDNITRTSTLQTVVNDIADDAEDPQVIACNMSSVFTVVTVKEGSVTEDGGNTVWYWSNNTSVGNITLKAVGYSKKDSSYDATFNVTNDMKTRHQTKVVYSGDFTYYLRMTASTTVSAIGDANSSSSKWDIINGRNECTLKFCGVKITTGPTQPVSIGDTRAIPGRDDADGAMVDGFWQYTNYVLLSVGSEYKIESKFGLETFIDEISTKTIPDSNIYDVFQRAQYHVYGLLIDSTNYSPKDTISDILCGYLYNYDSVVQIGDYGDNDSWYNRLGIVPTFDVQGSGENAYVKFNRRGIAFEQTRLSEDEPESSYTKRVQIYVRDGDSVDDRYSYTAFTSYSKVNDKVEAVIHDYICVAKYGTTYDSSPGSSRTMVPTSTNIEDAYEEFSSTSGYNGDRTDTTSNGYYSYYFYRPYSGYASLPDIVGYVSSTLNYYVWMYISSLHMLAARSPQGESTIFVGNGSTKRYTSRGKPSFVYVGDELKSIDKDYSYSGTFQIGTIEFNVAPDKGYLIRVGYDGSYRYGMFGIRFGADGTNYHTYCGTNLCVFNTGGSKHWWTSTDDVAKDICFAVPEKSNGKSGYPEYWIGYIKIGDFSGNVTSTSNNYALNFTNVTSGVKVNGSLLVPYVDRAGINAIKNGFYSYIGGEYKSAVCNQYPTMYTCIDANLSLCSPSYDDSYMGGYYALEDSDYTYSSSRKRGMVACREKLVLYHNESNN